MNIARLLDLEGRPQIPKYVFMRGVDRFARKVREEIRTGSVSGFNVYSDSLSGLVETLTTGGVVGISEEDAEVITSKINALGELMREFENLYDAALEIRIKTLRIDPFFFSEILPNGLLIVKEEDGSGLVYRFQETRINPKGVNYFKGEDDSGLVYRFQETGINSRKVNYFRGEDPIGRVESCDRTSLEKDELLMQNSVGFGTLVVMEGADGFSFKNTVVPAFTSIYSNLRF